MIKDDNTRITAVISKEVYKKLVKEAKYEDRSISNMVAKILRERYNIKVDE